LASVIERLIELDEQAAVKQHERDTYLSMMAAVIEALPDGLVVSDAAGKVVLFNSQAEFMFGYPRAEVIGQTLEKLLPERDRARHVHDREVYNRFEVSQRARTMGVGMELTGMRRDGHEFPADITLSRLVLPKGVFNLAAVRFSPNAMVRSVARDRSRDPEQDNKEPDAGR